MARKDNLLWTSLLLLTFMMCLIAGVIATCFVFFADPALLSLVVFPLFATIFFIADRKYALKVKTVYTARFIRLTVCYVFVLLLACLASVTLYGALACVIDVYLVTNLRYVLLPLLVLCLPFLAAIANFFDQLYEIPRNASYLKKAQKKLAEADLIKIGITGSYGKTTVKNILASVLSEKYRVLVTPASYNTPLGIARSVNRNRLEDYDVFIAEMGARHTGDIAQLCETVRPDYALITGICPQHLQSFGSVEAIVAAKGEILAGSSTGAVLGGDEYTLSLYENSPVETLIAGKDVKVSDVVATHEGTRFVLIIGKEKRTVRTKLLGRHTADNMCMAATMAHFMGMQIDEIVAGLEKADYIPHRLQPIHEEDVTILDDSYNANVKGAAAAVEVLSLFPGRHIVVTPGLVELGILEEGENEKLGESLVSLDQIVLVGDTLVTSVKRGFVRAGGDCEKLTIVPTLDDAQRFLAEHLEKGDTVLFLNDLPDVYNVV